MKSEITYYIWADQSCLVTCYSEEEAREKFEIVKQNYIKNSSEIILKEDVE